MTEFLISNGEHKSTTIYKEGDKNLQLYARVINFP